MFITCGYLIHLELCVFVGVGVSYTSNSFHTCSYLIISKLIYPLLLNFKCHSCHMPLHIYVIHTYVTYIDVFYLLSFIVYFLYLYQEHPILLLKFAINIDVYISKISPHYMCYSKFSDLWFIVYKLILKELTYLYRVFS